MEIIWNFFSNFLSIILRIGCGLLGIWTTWMTIKFAWKAYSSDRETQHLNKELDRGVNFISASEDWSIRLRFLKNHVLLVSFGFATFYLFQFAGGGWENKSTVTVESNNETTPSPQTENTSMPVKQDEVIQQSVRETGTNNKSTVEGLSQQPEVTNNTTSLESAEKSDAPRTDKNNVPITTTSTDPSQLLERCELEDGFFAKNNCRFKICAKEENSENTACEKYKTKEGSGRNK